MQPPNPQCLAQQFTKQAKMDQKKVLSTNNSSENQNSKVNI